MAINDSIGLTIRVKAEEASKNIKNAKNETNNFKKSLSGLRKDIENAFSTSNIVAWTKIIKDSINNMIKASEAQADYIESMNLLKVAFGDTAEEAEELIEKISNLTGFDPSTLTKYLSTFRQMSSALGITSEYADLLSQNLIKMQLDLASLYNMDVDTVGSKLQSAMAGQRTAIRAFGAEITESTLAVEAQRMGISKSVEEMTRAEKVILIYLTLEKQLVNANGDVARTINSVANQTKIFKEQIAIAGRQLGGLFIPILKSLLPVLNGILMAFNEIIASVLSLLGVDASKMAGEFGIASSKKSFDDFANSINGVSEANEKAKKSLVGWNKLNTITTPTESSSSGSGGIGGGVSQEMLDLLKEYDFHMSEIKSKATEIKENILKWLGFTRDENGELKWSAKLLGENIWKTIKDIATSKVFWVIVGITTGIILLVKAIKKLSDSKTSKTAEIMAKGFNKLSGALKAIAIGAEVLMILVGVAIALKSVAELIKTFSESGLEVADVALLLGTILLELAAATLAFVGIVKLLNTGDLVALTIVFAGIVAVLLTVNELFKTFEKLGNDVWKMAGVLGVILLEVSAAAFLLASAALLLSSPLALVAVLALIGGISAILLIMGEVLPKILDSLGTFIVKIGPTLVMILTTIESLIETIINSLGKVLIGIVKEVGNVFEKVFDGISKVVDTVGTAIVNVLDAIGRLIVTIKDSILDFLGGVGPAVERSVDAIIRSITKLINFVISGIEYLINTLIINSINQLLRNAQKVADFFEFLGFEIELKPLNKVSIERFRPQLYEDGGFVDEGQMFIAREAGPELVGRIGNKTAVINNDQIIDGVASGVARAMSGVNFGRNVNIIAEGDTQGLLDFITFKQMEKDRQYGF